MAIAISCCAAFQTQFDAVVCFFQKWLSGYESQRLKYRDGDVAAVAGSPNFQTLLLVASEEI